MGFSIKNAFKKVKEAVKNIPTKQGLKTFLTTGGMLPGIQEGMLTDGGMDIYDDVHKGIVDAVTGGAIFQKAELEAKAKKEEEKAEAEAAAKEADRIADIIPDDILPYAVERSAEGWAKTAEERMAAAKGHYGDLDVKYWDEADQNLARALAARDAGNAGDQDKYFKLWRREYQKSEALGLKKESEAAAAKKKENDLKSSREEEFFTNKSARNTRPGSGESFRFDAGQSMRSILGIDNNSTGGNRSVLGT